EQPALDVTAKEIAATGANVLAVRTDVSKLADIEALRDKAFERFKAVPLIFNNGGVGGGRGTLDSTQKDWEWVIGVNLWGVINGVRTFVPRMIADHEEGYVVNTASIAGLIVGAGGPGYTVTKHGVIALSESLYYELQMAGTKIKVSVLCPALTNTSILESGRNHPDGPAEEPAEGPQDRVMLDMMRGIFKTGML